MGDKHLINVLGAFALALADRIRDATESAAGMTGAAPAALVALHQFLAGRTTEDLAQATGLTHSGAVRLIDRLVAAGLVERRPGRDGRSLSIVLTATGRALSDRVTVARATAIEAALDGLSSDDRQALVGLTASLMANITGLRMEARARNEEPVGSLCRLCDLGSCGFTEGECPAANAAHFQAAKPDSRRPNMRP